MAVTDYDPRIRVPDPCPIGPPGKVVTALIAWLSRSPADGKTGSEASRRWLASGLVRTDDKAASALLRRLCKPDRNGNQWLVLKTKSVGLQAHKYGLGPAALPNQPEWQALGERLFSRRGYLSEFMNRGIIRHRELNVTGCLVLGYMMVNGPSAKGELFASLDDFMGRRTITSALTKAIDAGLVEALGDEYSLVASFWDAVDVYETERGLTELVGAKEAKHDVDRAIRREEVRTRNDLQGFKNALRDLPCTYCGTIPKRGKGTVEHFPPLHWGGSDRFSMLFPACAKCNEKDAPLIKGTQKIETLSPSKTRFDIPGDPAQFLRDLMFMEHDRYAVEMALGRPEVARERMKRIFPAWVAYRNGDAYTAAGVDDCDSFVEFIRITIDDPEFLNHCKHVQLVVAAHTAVVESE